jgi:hypothetical protein
MLTLLKMGKTLQTQMQKTVWEFDKERSDDNLLVYSKEYKHKGGKKKRYKYICNNCHSEFTALKSFKSHNHDGFMPSGEHPSGLLKKILLIKHLEADKRNNQGTALFLTRYSSTFSALGCTLPLELLPKYDRKMQLFTPTDNFACITQTGKDKSQNDGVEQETKQGMQFGHILVLIYYAVTR